MTKKHFEVVAQGLAKGIAKAGLTDKQALTLAMQVAVALEQTNPRFDACRFTDRVEDLVAMGGGR